MRLAKPLELLVDRPFVAPPEQPDDRCLWSPSRRATGPPRFVSPARLLVASWIFNRIVCTFASPFRVDLERVDSAVHV